MYGAEINELPMKDWQDYIVKQEDEKEQTFAEWMLDNGKSPQVICGTMYEV
jgi:hypothetical protein